MSTNGYEQTNTYFLFQLDLGGKYTDVEHDYNQKPIFNSFPSFQIFRNQPDKYKAQQKKNCFLILLDFPCTNSTSTTRDFNKVSAYSIYVLFAQSYICFEERSKKTKKLLILN